MKRPSSLPVLFQVGALAAAAVIASQAVAFAVVLLAPPPRPDGFNVAAAAAALQGRPAATSDGRALTRRITDRPPPTRTGGDPIESVITAVLAEHLAVPTDRVRVAVQHDRHAGPPPEHLRMRDHVVRRESAAGSTTLIARSPAQHARTTSETVITVLRGSGAVTRPDAVGKGQPSRVAPQREPFAILSERLSFAPFTASLRLEDGRWATVEPPRDWLSPWQQRILLALLISALILAPLVWWMARRLTRPIRVFAEAAERLGADPDAEPLASSGPAEVRTAIGAFNDMQASIRDHMRKRTQTIAAIAHDLRTPLTRLRFRAEQAPDGVRDRMAADIEEMDALIAQAMAFVRGEATPDRREVFDLDALAADCTAGFAETGAAVTFDGGAPLAVEADPAALRRALANLIGNAVKYAGAARVKAFAEDGMAVVTVEDDGPGLPDAELDAVFEPFRRGERSRNRETGGAGLGLTVARQAARAHGGDVTLISRTGGGLSARLTLSLSDQG